MSGLDFIDIRDLFKKLKGHVRSEVEEYVDKMVGKLKDEAVMCIVSKVFNNMIDDRPLNEHKINKQIDKPKKVRQVNIEYDQTQNREVINTLFVGKTLIGKYKGKTYEVIVNDKGNFVYSGEEYNSPSAVGTGVTGKSCNGWDFFKVCLDTKERFKTLGYHRAKFFFNK